MAMNILLDETVDLLKAMVAIPSVSGAEGPVADFLAARLGAFFPNQTIRRLGRSLALDIAGTEGDGPRLMLCSHIDTVPVADGWTRDPFGAEVEDDRIYGLGANDAGASVVGMIAAARRMERRFKGHLLLCLVAEEEKGDQGFVKIEPDVPRYDGAVFGEPTDMGLASALRGTMRAVMRSRGKACHASRPWEGANACDRLADDIRALRALDLKDSSPWKGATVEPTIVQGGKSFNQIPGLIETTLDIRTTPEKDNDWIARAFEKAGPDIEITINRRRPLHADPQSALIRAARKVMPPLEDYVFHGGCDMSFSTAPSIVMGPGRSERSHVADEFIAVPEIARAIDIYAALASAFLA